MAEAAPERRREQFAGDFGYFIYPIAGDIPGLGTASGFGGTVLNMFGTDADVTGFDIDGDFAASGLAILDIHLIPEHLILDFGNYDFDVAPTVYSRGINSDKDDYILPRAEGDYRVAQLTLSFDERRYELYARHLLGRSRVTEVRDRDGTPFDSVDTRYHDARSWSVGINIDRTDDRLDPRSGVRLEAAANFPNVDDPNASEYYVTNYNLTGYLPLRSYDTLAFNAFLSDAHVTNKATTDYGTLQSLIGLNCERFAVGQGYEECIETESKFINERIAANRYGTASSLGGTQRLRSFDNGRFYAGNALSYGVEYRWNLTDEYTPFNIYIAKGVRTGLQLAAFAEQGTVAEHNDDLFKNLKTSYGAGFRAVLSGVIIRADYALGEEGNAFILFINYPWSMFSVDNPA